MASRKRIYDAEFREGAVRIVTETGKPIPEVTEDLGIHPGTLHSWVSRARRNGSPSSDCPVAEPATGGRRVFVSGKKRQNTIKTTTISDPQGRTLWNGADRPGRMHDQTAVRTEGIAGQLRLHPAVKAEVDEGYRGLANEFPGQVTAPPKKPKDDVTDGEKRFWREMRRRQSSRRIVVEHANAEMRQWRPLQRYTGRREDYAETHYAIAGLVSDRAARRSTRPVHSTELVLARHTAC